MKNILFILSFICISCNAQQQISPLKTKGFPNEDVKTTIPFHRQLMDHEDYLAGNYTTKFMEDFVMDRKYDNH